MSLRHCGWWQELADHNVRVVYVHVGATTLELLQPLGTGSVSSPIAKFLERNPRGGVHHLCFTVSQQSRQMNMNPVLHILRVLLQNNAVK